MYIAPFIHVFIILPFGINECFAIRQNQPHSYQRMHWFLKLNITDFIEEPTFLGFARLELEYFLHSL